MAALIPAHLDHLVVTVPDLPAAVAEIERATGVPAVPGGRHPGLGTANFLIGLAPAGRPDGAHTYLEILGPDPEQEAPADGTLPLDAHLATAPTLRTWAIHPPAMAATVAAVRTAGIDVGEVRDMSRETAEGNLLAWQLTSRSPLPQEGIQPFLIDWGDSVHPAEAALPSLDLLEFIVEVPYVAATRSMLEVLGAGDTEVATGPERRLRARLRGPGGELTF
ncbi:MULTISPECIES: VOC family protein [Brevibacterium]|uniref:VOC family protein n=1 Tax=Brevibacterium casei TaxID=33889 RepID=A0A7T4A1M9_9MICO|nr:MULTISPECIES: VOC family protein [Brevibacterium]QQB15675.1 VOC family protein [Brevibacterium casei]